MCVCVCVCLHSFCMLVIVYYNFTIKCELGRHAALYLELFALLNVREQICAIPADRTSQSDGETVAACIGMVVPHRGEKHASTAESWPVFS